MVPKRVDNNQAEIVEALRAVGCTVQHLHEVGKGCPDLLVGIAGRNYLIEVKSEKGRLTGAEFEWHARWKGHVHIIRTVEMALELVKGALDG